MSNRCVRTWQPMDSRHWLIIRVLLPLGCLTSLTSILSGCTSAPPPTVRNVPPPPEPVVLSNAEVTNYASTVLEIEPHRRDAYNQIEQITGKVPTNIACHQPSTIEDLSVEVKAFFVNYCTKAKQIVQQNGLAITHFNDITANVPIDRALRQRLQEELLRQQRNPFTKE